MKISIVIRKLNIQGGVQRHVLYLAQNLKKMGNDVTIYTFLYSKEDTFTKLTEGLNVVSLDWYPKYKNAIQNLFAENMAAKRMAKMIDRDTDVLNVHDHMCFKIPTYFSKRNRKAKSVWTMHDMPTKWFSFLRHKSNNPEIKLSLLKKMLYKFVDSYEAMFIQNLDKIVVLDERDREYISKFFGKDALIVRNGVDIEMFPFKERAFMSKPIKLLMNGIFFPHRRFEDGIEALKMLQDEDVNATLTIVGDQKSDTKYFESLKKKVVESGLGDSVIFTGRISEEDFVASYQNHDIFLFPNHLQSWGLAVFEAMSSGLPAIVSSSAGASEVLDQGINALIVEPKNPEDIAEKIKMLINDKSLYNNLSTSGRRFVEENISWEKHAKDMLQVFELAHE